MSVISELLKHSGDRLHDGQKESATMLFILLMLAIAKRKIASTVLQLSSEHHSSTHVETNVLVVVFPPDYTQ